MACLQLGPREMTSIRDVSGGMGGLQQELITEVRDADPIRRGAVRLVRPVLVVVDAD